ncbi:hypothetical protein SESBI_12165 [Sesbania bispinosa]|nr:hypothetical protein SESBI_12165 [Sesbania bispinosa]
MDNNNGGVVDTKKGGIECQMIIIVAIESVKQYLWWQRVSNSSVVVEGIDMGWRMLGNNGIRGCHTRIVSYIYGVIDVNEPK